jgi:WD40 repeat protein/CubicO group peptidase (beta-lactamase class C family)
MVLSPRITNQKALVIVILLLVFPILIKQGYTLNKFTNTQSGLVESKNKNQGYLDNEYTNFANLSGHLWEVTSVAFSPSGDILASAANDNRIRIWNVSTGSLVRILHNHSSGVSCLAFSLLNNDLLASSSWDNTIKIWNYTTGELLQTLTGHELGIRSIAYSPDGALLVSSDGEFTGSIPSSNPVNGTIKLWNTTDWTMLRNLTGHTDIVQSVAFSNDGKQIVSGSWDKTIRFWNVTSGEELFNMTGHAGAVHQVIFSPDGKTIASGSQDKTIKIWNASTGDLMQTLMSDNQEIWCLAFSPTGDILAAGDGIWDPVDGGIINNATIRLWNVTSGSELYNLTGHTSTVSSVAFSPDGSTLASSSWDWTIKLWGDREPIPDRFAESYWPTSSPEEQGMNSTILNDMFEFIQRYRSSLHSVLVLRNGVLVAEKYYSGDYHVWTRSSKHALFSCTKSITSILVGIAIDKGFIDSVDQKVLDFFPERTVSNVDARKENMTLENLLTMTSGLDWPEWGLGWNNPEYAYRMMVESQDWVQFVLDRPMVYEPGEVFNYNTGCSQLLSAIIQKTTGKTALSFAQEHLFNHLDIEQGDMVWFQDPQGVYIGGTDSFLKPQDMAKIGYLYLNNGSWDGKQLVSAEWVENSTRSYSSIGYGYQWWIAAFGSYGEIKGYNALGFNNQKIYVVPELDLVVAFTSGFDDSGFLVSNYIIPSIIKEPEVTETTTQTSSTTTTTTTTATTTPSVTGFDSITGMMLLVTIGTLVLINRRRKKIN